MARIIQIRGTSGSGKTTAMVKVLRALSKAQGSPEVQYVTGRKRPRSYFFNGLLYVMGGYETACGGCDGIGSAKAVYDLTRQLIDSPDNARIILQEGLLLSEDTKWAKTLQEEGETVSPLFLTTPLEVCLAQVEMRRKEAGNDKPLNPKNTSNRIATIERARVKLTEAGITCVRCSADQAPRIILKWLGMLGPQI